MSLARSTPDPTGTDPAAGLDSNPDTTLTGDGTGFADLDNSFSSFTA